MSFALRPLRSFFGIVYRALYNEVIAHDGIEHAGYLAFLSLLSLFPFLVLLVTLAGIVGQGEAGSRFIQLLFENLPPGAVIAIRPRIDEIVSGPPQGLLGLAIVGAIWTSSSMVEGMRTILNRAYHVHTPPAYWLRRLTSIMQLLLILVITLVVMTALIAVPLVATPLLHLLGLPLPDLHGTAWSGTVFLISAVVIFLVVANLYYVLPNIKQSLFSVVPGAIVVVVLWLSAASLFTAYLAHFKQVQLIYGSIGGFIATLIFFYISHIIFIFGAELNYQLKIAGGTRIEEKETVQSDAPLA